MPIDSTSNAAIQRRPPMGPPPDAAQRMQRLEKALEGDTSDEAKQVSKALEALKAAKEQGVEPTKDQMNALRDAVKTWRQSKGENAEEVDAPPRPKHTQEERQQIVARLQQLEESGKAPWTRNDAPDGSATGSLFDAQG